MENKKFDQWAIVEIMGHQRYAGRVTEQAVGGTSFVRVDVPGTSEREPFTKLFGSSAIYAITVVDEETAKAAVGEFRQQPLDEWSARRMLGIDGMQQQIEYSDFDGDQDFDEGVVA